jgi:hypothetical protein
MTLTLTVMFGTLLTEGYVCLTALQLELLPKTFPVDSSAA